MKTIAIYAATFILLVSFASRLSARLKETESEIEARYGKPMSKEAFEEIDPQLDAKRTKELAQRSADDRARDLQIEHMDNPQDFRKDGSRIDFVGEDALVYADSRLIFYNSASSAWEDLRSSVLDRRPTVQDSDALKRMTANARKYLRQRFYVANGIGISVVFLGGRSVSETYHQKGHLLPSDSVEALIKKSFPDGVLQDEERQYPRMTRILSDSKELQGCATYIDGDLKISATAYFGFLKAIEEGLRNNAALKEHDKINGF